MTTFILKTSFLIELIGAVILFPVFTENLDLAKESGTLYFMRYLHSAMPDLI